MPHKEFYRRSLPHFQQPGQIYFVTWSLKDAVPPKALQRFKHELQKLKYKIENRQSGARVQGERNSDSVPTYFHSKHLDTHSEILKSSSYAKFLDTGSETRAPKKKVRAYGGGAHEPDVYLLELKQQYQNVRKQYLKAYNDLLDTLKTSSVDLSKPEITAIIAKSLHYWENKRIINHAFCIMPNHIHWVVELLEKDEAVKPVYLEDLLKSVKRFTANTINKHENRKGSLWQDENFDTTMGDEEHLYHAIEYTINNLVKAGFVNNRNDWKGNFFSG